MSWIPGMLIDTAILAGIGFVGYEVFICYQETGSLAVTSLLACGAGNIVEGVADFGVGVAEKMTVGKYNETVDTAKECAKEVQKKKDTMDKIGTAIGCKVEKDGFSAICPICQIFG